MENGKPARDAHPLPPARSGEPGPEEAVAPIPRGMLSEDHWAIVLGITVMCLALAAVMLRPNSLAGWFAQPGKWNDWPLRSLIGEDLRGPWLGSLVSIALIGVLGIVALWDRRTIGSGGRLEVVGGFLMLAALATAAFVMAGQEVLKQYGLEYVLWALLLGMMISNTVGVPGWLRGAVRGELFIKWGLVLLGAEVLLGKLIALGLPGIMVSWVVTPIVLVVTFWFGCRVLKIPSPSLVIVVAADMSVCGVSAAIATAAACRAKKEELSLAVSMSLLFTAVMMVAMPMAFRWAGVDDIVGGAWIGGTIDSTGAVAAAGVALGERAETIAVTIKMIQNVLIGAIAFAVSVYWATRYHAPQVSQAPHSGQFFTEVWRRFPKFVLGFLGVSVVASALAWSGTAGEAFITTTVDMVTKHVRNWLFCLAFVCIGLEIHFRTLLPALSGGRTLVLYIAGQTFNIILTGLMAWLVFGWLFRDAIMEWLQ